MNKTLVLITVIVAAGVWITRGAQQEYEAAIESLTEQRIAKLDRLERLHMGLSTPATPQPANKDSRLEDFHTGRNNF